jgi:16S rRNA (cytosine967-C5)-methyltransferase
MNTARHTALQVLNRCFRDSAWSSQTIDIEAKHLDERDRALVTHLVLGVLQNVTLLDTEIDAFLHGKKTPDLPVRNILRLGAFQLLFSDKIPPRAAVYESVQLCREAGFSSAAGLVNAVLRKIADAGLLPTDDLSVLYSHPRWFVERMIERHGRAFTEALLQANNTEAPLDYHDAFAQGERYVQDMAAYTAVEMAKPEPGIRVLDVCSAPGGKAFTAAVMMENRGSILACDLHEKKLRLIRESAQRLGISIITVQCGDASVYDSGKAEAFDLVIADVPCSGFGVIRKKPEIRFKTEEQIRNLPVIQKKIAENVAGYVKPGGKLLYATCTVFEEENEEIAHALQGFEILKEKTFWPHIDGTDGFYACVLRKC